MDKKCNDGKRLSRHGLVEMWKGFGPAVDHIIFSHFDVESVAVGYTFGLLLGANGKVYSFDPRSNVSPIEPCLVSSLSDKKVVGISCGSSHAGAVCENGDLFMWGANSQGQCGTDVGFDNAANIIPVPSFVNLRDFLHTCPVRKALVWTAPKVREISCGSEHTVAVTHSGQLWTWGNVVCQEGVAQRGPHKLPLPGNRRVLSLACGHRHNLAIVVEVSKRRDSPVLLTGCVPCDRIAREASGDLVVSSPDHCPLGLQVIDSSPTVAKDASPSKCKDKSIKEEENAALSVGFAPGQLPALRMAGPEDDLRRDESLAVTCGTAEDLNKEVSRGDGMPNHKTALENVSTGDTCPSEETFVVLRHKDVANHTDSSVTPQQRAASTLSFTESFVKNVGLHDAQCILNRFAKQLYSDVMGSVAAPSVQNTSSSRASASMIQCDAAKNTVEKFSFVSKLSWVDDGDLSESLQDVELNSFDIKSENQFGVSVCEPTSLDSQSLKLYRKRKKDAWLQNKVSSVEDLDRWQSTPFLHFEQPHCVVEEPVVWEAEVWSWGQGSLGQLGHGDALDRLWPTCVRLLNGRVIVKVAAGHSHAMALTATGIVYVWGSNSHGQLGLDFDEERVYSPTLMTCADKSLIQDVAAGHKHSVLLRTTGGEQCVGVVGKQEGAMEKADVMKTSNLILHNVSFKECKMKAVFAGGLSCGCIMDSPSVSGYLSILYELASAEFQFFSQLNELKEVVVQPLLNKDALAVACGASVQLLFHSFLDVTKNAGENAHRLWYLIHRFDERDCLSVLRQIGSELGAFANYCAHFCDVLAINGFAVCVRASNSVWKKARQVLTGLRTDADCKGGAVSSETLLRMMEEPIRHMSQYEKLFANMAAQKSNKDGSFCWEHASAKNWHKLVAEVTLWKEQAEQTRAFWDCCSPKMAEQLRSPSRRLLRDSKAHPVSLMNAGRFTSHWFILFNDAFVHSQYSAITCYDLVLVWVDPAIDLEGEGTAFALTFPEDVLLKLVCNTSHNKTEWVRSFNDAINARLMCGNVADASSAIGASGKRTSAAFATRRTPPLFRHASYTFTKLGDLRDATYTGSWLCGQMQGHGELVWPDAQRYVGNFKRNLQHGYGKFTTFRTPGGEETIYEGNWMSGKLNGLGSIRFSNGDTFDGYFQHGLRNGHGVLKQGQFLSTAASIYIGQWVNDQRHGYGVTDNIAKGEKYMGTWHEGCRHGKGVLVTLDGLYYEGNFSHDKMAGYGIMYEDGYWYEGEVGPDGTFGGRGLLMLSCGDSIEGTFGGSWETGIRVNGTYTKASIRRTGTEMAYPKVFGTFCVPADQKWKDMFQHCLEMMGVGETQNDFQRAWESVAVAITTWKTIIKQRHLLNHAIDVLERIPSQGPRHVTVAKYQEIRSYLIKAFESPYHPLGKLMDGLVDVYRATYIGIGTHQCLLSHAVAEVHSFVSRIYDVIRILFPTLPSREQQEEEEEEVPARESSESDDTCDDQREAMTPHGLLLPILLPKIYPPLFTLYAIHNEKDDELYWETLLKWNKQSDLSLMSFLQIDEKFWITCEMHNKCQSPKRLFDVCYLKAIDSLQRISTTFCPSEKLKILQCAFEEINNEVQGIVGDNYTWTMDDLFPVFQYVVVRARIRHLGSEIHMIDELMEARLKNGELGIMFTMLKACYFQVKNEWSLSI